MLDIFIAVFSALTTISMAGLGVYVSLHPTRSLPRKRRYKWGFLGCGVLSVILIGLQTYRNSKAQTTLIHRLDKIDSNTSKPPTFDIKVPPAQVTVIGEAQSHAQSQAQASPESGKPPHYSIKVGGLTFTPSDNDGMRVQITTTVNNSGSPSYAYEWKLITAFPDREVTSLHLMGQRQVGDMDLPSLDGQQFTSDRPYEGLLYFFLAKLTSEEQAELRSCSALNGKAPIRMTLSALNSKGKTIGATEIPIDELRGQKCEGNGAQK